MGRRRWKRVRLADLADRETQEGVLGCIEAAREGEQAPERENQLHERPATGRSGARQG